MDAEGHWCKKNSGAAQPGVQRHASSQATVAHLGGRHRVLALLWQQGEQLKHAGGTEALP